MIKEVIKGVASSERFWLTVSGILVLGLAKANIAVPDDFASKLADMVMVLVGSLGLRPPREKHSIIKEGK